MAETKKYDMFLSNICLFCIIYFLDYSIFYNRIFDSNYKYIPCLKSKKLAANHIHQNLLQIFAQMVKYISNYRYMHGLTLCYLHLWTHRVSSSAFRHKTSIRKYKTNSGYNKLAFNGTKIKNRTNKKQSGKYLITIQKNLMDGIDRKKKDIQTVLR